MASTHLQGTSSRGPRRSSADTTAGYQTTTSVGPFRGSYTEDGFRAPGSPIYAHPTGVRHVFPANFPSEGPLVAPQPRFRLRGQPDSSSGPVRLAGQGDTSFGCAHVPTGYRARDLNCQQPFEEFVPAATAATAEAARPGRLLNNVRSKLGEMNDALERRRRSVAHWMNEKKSVRLPPAASDIKIKIPALYGPSAFCQCASPSHILPVERFECERCAIPGVICARCQLPIRCPCWSKRKVRSKRRPKPQPLPELVVTRVSPEEEKREPGFFECGGLPGLPRLNFPQIPLPSCDFGEKLGRTLAKSTCVQPSPPPYPHPPPPLGFLSCFDPPPKPPPAEPSICSRVMSCGKASSPPPRPLPRGGLCGLWDDVRGIGAVALGQAVETAGHVMERTVGPLPKVNDHVCQEPLYPDPDGQYTGRVPHSTARSGIPMIDKVNEILDSWFCEPPDHNAAVEFRPDPIPETQKTGNRIIDSINEALDDVLPLPPSPQLPSPVQPATASSTSSSASSGDRDLAGFMRHCRDKLKDDFGAVDWSKLSPFKASKPLEPLEPEDTWVEKMVPCLKSEAPLQAQSAYQEACLERFAPSFFGKKEAYCPHCRRNRFTGRELAGSGDACAKLKPSCQMPTCGPSTSDFVNFDLFNAKPTGGGWAEDGGGRSLPECGGGGVVPVGRVR